jgi:hypothetical protein
MVLNKPGMVLHACNTCTWEGEARETLVGSQAVILSEKLSNKVKQKKSFWICKRRFKSQSKLLPTPQGYRYTGKYRESIPG